MESVNLHESEGQCEHERDGEGGHDHAEHYEYDQDPRQMYVFIHYLN